MCQIMQDDGTVRDEVIIRNLIYQFDDYFTFRDLLDKLKKDKLNYEMKYVSKIIDEMMYYNTIKKYGIHFKTTEFE
jgi:hypothetical protein